jgi:Poly(ADP-ribose) polymerase catalytic domain
VCACLHSKYSENCLLFLESVVTAPLPFSSRPLSGSQFRPIFVMAPLVQKAYLEHLERLAGEDKKRHHRLPPVPIFPAPFEVRLCEDLVALTGLTSVAVQSKLSPEEVVLHAGGQLGLLPFSLYLRHGGGAEDAAAALDPGVLLSPSETYELRARFSPGEAMLVARLHELRSERRIEVEEAAEKLKSVEAKMKSVEAKLTAARAEARRVADDAAEELLEEVERSRRTNEKLTEVTSALRAACSQAAEARISAFPFACTGIVETVLDPKLPETQHIWSVALRSVRKHANGKRVYAAPVLELVRVKALHDSRSWERYLQEARRVASELREEAAVVLKGTALCPQPGPSGARQALLFHGTSPGSVEKIRTSGLRISTRSDCMFGQGIYLAENLSKSDLYCKVDRKDAVRTVFVCRALLGNCQRMNRHDHGLVGAPEGHHSVWGATKEDVDEKGEVGALDHREYVVYDGCRVHVQYLLEYVHAENCRCLTCF